MDKITETKKYKLLRDLPDAKAGTIFTFDGDDSYDYKSAQYEDGKSWYKNVVVENNPDWFELIPIPSKEVQERIIVGDVTQWNMTDVLNGGRYLKVDISDYPKHWQEKIPAIKQAIEAVLNEDTVVGDRLEDFHICCDGGIKPYNAFICSKCKHPQSLSFKATLKEVEKYKQSLPKEQQDNTKPFLEVENTKKAKYSSFEELELSQDEKLDMAAKFIELYRHDHTMTPHRIAHSLLYPTRTMNAYEQQSKSPTSTSAEWEIVAARDADGKLWYTDMIPTKGETIEAVKRISDGAVFTIGDKVNGVGEILTIEKFEIEYTFVNLMKVCFNEGGFYSIEKLPQPTNLQPKKEDNQVTDNSDVACLSLNDIKWWIEKYFDFPNGISIEKLRPLVNEKLKQ